MEYNKAPGPDGIPTRVITALPSRQHGVQSAGGRRGPSPRAHGLRSDLGERLEGEKPLKFTTIPT